MEKMIVLRFQAKCKSCSMQIASGERAIWLGKGSGVKHIQCQTPSQEIRKPKPETERNEFTIDYAELREAWEKFIHSPPGTVYGVSNETARQHLLDCWRDSNWSGSTEAEMRDYIANGYNVEGLDGVNALIPAKPRRKLRYSEDGDELLLDLAWAGVDEPFTEWEKRVSKPGLTVEIHMIFNAHFPAKTITQYQRWIARALQTLDENGVDMEVSVTMHNDRILGNENAKTSIRVRKAGEASDFSNWSAMFSPGGFRQLGLLAAGIHTDRVGKNIPYGYGSAGDYGSWDVAYDEESGHIVIGNDGMNYDFPEHEMTEKLQSVLAKLNG